ncbi:uncharacterized protein LOC112466217 [Temnothorax curvispinosus]|uniref:Uncharacterized protein LOC112466217 n=1 Tax=Temnothorax curvispinosus TaxID=300111 RepID=A0A6J1R6W8_9HYME|nr:uncharacterized protein LOC112466217 [Temnothorax curvispinosus]
MSNAALTAAQARAEEAENQLAQLQTQFTQLQDQFAQMRTQWSDQGLDTVNSNAIDNNIQIPRIDNYRVPKISPFSQVDPELWFIQAELSMRNARITVQSTMADTVLAALDVEILNCVRDIIKLRPPPEDIYEQVKARIIATYAPSDETKLRKLLRGQVGTDGKPSLILSRLRGLNGGNVDDNVIRSIFLDQLPCEHRAILVSTRVTDLNRIAEAADRMAESARGNEPYASAVSKGNSPPPAKTEIQQLIERMEKMDNMMASFKKELNSRSRSRSNSRRRRTSTSPNRAITPALCPAHTKYPDNPTSCRTWCSKYETWNSTKN